MTLPEYPVEYFRGTSPLLDNPDCWHRRGVSDCPHCGEDYTDKQYSIWDKLPYVTQMIFEPKYFKKGRVVVVSYCPKCHMPSWCHRELIYLIHRLEFSMHYPEEDRIPYDLARVQEEYDRLVADAKAKWDNSLCKVCKVKKTIKESELGNYISCKGEDFSRMGSPEQPDAKPPFKCTRFKK